MFHSCIYLAFEDQIILSFFNFILMHHWQICIISHYSGNLVIHPAFNIYRAPTCIWLRQGMYVCMYIYIYIYIAFWTNGGTRAVRLVTPKLTCLQFYGTVFNYAATIHFYPQPPYFFLQMIVCMMPKLLWLLTCILVEMAYKDLCGYERYPRFVTSFAYMLRNKLGHG